MDLYRPELPGILNRALMGYADFLKRGKSLDPPAAVSAATNDYREQEDVLGRFLKECIEYDPAAEGIKTSEIAKAFSAWCGENNEHVRPLSSRVLASKLRDRGLPVEKQGRGGWVRLLGYRFIHQKSMEQPHLKLVPDPSPEPAVSSPKSGTSSPKERHE